MEKDNLRFSELIARKKMGLLTEAEAAELEQILETSDSRRALSESVLKVSLQSKYKQYHAVDNPDAWTDFEKKRNAGRGKKLYYRSLFAAASVVLIVGMGLFWVLSKGPDTAKMAPGQRKSDFKVARLYLPDGRQVELTGKDTLFAGVQTEIKNTSEALRYEQAGGMGKEVWNTLETPLGGEYHVILSDGTKVWLNAGSRLTYPENFLGESRIVTLDGEGFFDVSRTDKTPFIIHTNGMDIEVLGTTFNVKSYPGENKTVTTLISGRINAVIPGKDTLLMYPDQQVVLERLSGEITFREVIAVDYAAWKEGRFIFKEEGLEAVMADLARWYNVRVVYEEEEAKQFGFTGMIDRYKEIEETLAIIEKTGKVVFTYKNNTIYVRLK